MPKSQRIFVFVNACMFVAIALTLSMCSAQPVEIKYGIDKCAWCENVIDDQHFASTLVAQGGETFKFNSIECLMAFHIQPTISREQFQASYVCDHNNPGHLLRAGQATFVHTVELPTPNGLGLFAFASDAAAETFMGEVSGEAMEWDEVKAIVNEAWFAQPADTLMVDSAMVDSTGM